MAGGTRFVGLDILVYVNISAAVAAARDIGAGASGVRYTAKTPGVGGNSVRVAHVAAAGTNAPTSVGVVGNDITVTLGTGATAGVVNATAAQVRDAVNAHPGASGLVSASLIGDGTGLAAASAIAALAGGADAGLANYQPAAHQKDLEISDETDTASASSKTGGGFASDFPTIRSIGFTLNALRCYDEPTQQRLYRAYDQREEVMIQYTVPKRLTGSATDTIRRARALLTSFSESFPETDMATVSAGVSLQEKWEEIAA